MKRTVTYFLSGLLWLVSCTDKMDDDKPVSDGVVPSANATVYGVVKCGNEPLKGVAVSDGVDIVVTDSRGVYNLNSKKKNAQVFISVPSGYAMNSYGSASCKFWQSLVKKANQQERVDFNLMKEDQSAYKMVVMGDIHLYSTGSANRFADTFVTEINDYVSGNGAQPVYGMTLGDMTWDWYWYENKFGIEQYLPVIDQLRGISVYNTVGNHDNDMKFNSKQEFLTTGEDWTCMKKYRALQGPTCFSYNIGGVHYVSIDNVITTNTGGTSDKDSRGCWRGITKTDMNWLKKDLALVSKDTPVVVSLHMPLFSRKSVPNAGVEDSENSTVEEIVAPFTAFENVVFISAHTHQCYNTVDYQVDDFKVTEWNSGAVCGNFWGSSGSGLNVCTDGTPGGYRILSVANGKIISSNYKGTGKKSEYVFRTYDRNMMNLDAETIAGYTAGGVAGPDANNWVYIRIWDYKPSWKLSVKEGSKELLPIQIDSYDPLYLLMYAEKKTKTNPSRTVNMFKVQASSATSTLSIKVTDDYDRTYTETMTRPKAFTFDTYLTEQTE